MLRRSSKGSAGGSGKDAKARARSKSSFQKGAFAGPDQPTLFECQEIRGKRNLKLTYIWVDMAGVKIISGKSKTVKLCLEFKGIISWEVQDDNFNLKIGSMVEGVSMEKKFVIGFEKVRARNEAPRSRAEPRAHCVGAPVSPSLSTARARFARPNLQPPLVRRASSNAPGLPILFPRLLACVCALVREGD